MSQAYDYTSSRVSELQGAFIRRVYNWMIAGLALTGLMAHLTATSQTLTQIVFGNPLVFFALIIGELALVFVLAGRAETMRPQTAMTLFIIYSLLNGLTLSFIFIAYARSTITSAFFVTAGTFGAMSFYGYVTKKDLTSWGSFLFMGLIGIIIASLVNMFFRSTMVSWVVTYAGVLIFVGLTAYDTQMLKTMAVRGFSGEEAETRAAVVGALRLYLDFINLFLMILRIFGGGRD